jgi:hypothetical protein
VDADTVYTALNDLEKQTRHLAKQNDNSMSRQMLQALDEDGWLVFTTGTAQTQKKLGGAKIKNLPLKAVQSFRIKYTTPMRIENGIYAFNSDFLPLNSREP